MIRALVLFFALSSTSLMAAENDCTQGIQATLAGWAPKTGIVTLTGKYTKKSQSGEYKACELSIKLDGNRLVPDVNPQKFNPNYGDGGAFWPFGNYPTAEPASDDYKSVAYFTCWANPNGFSIDYGYKEQSGWYKSKRYSLSLEKNSDGSYEASLRDGDPGLRAVSCRGEISEK